MKMIFFAVAALGLAACQATVATPREDFENDCENVFQKVNGQFKLKDSKDIETASSLACYYGRTAASASIACSIPVDTIPIFEANTNDTGGLRDKSAALIIASEGVGNNMAYKLSDNLLSNGVSEKNSDQCLTALHDQPRDLQTVRNMFPLLRRLGY